VTPSQAKLSGNFTFNSNCQCPVYEEFGNIAIHLNIARWAVWLRSHRLRRRVPAHILCRPERPSLGIPFDLGSHSKSSSGKSAYTLFYFVYVALLLDLTHTGLPFVPNTIYHLISIEVRHRSLFQLCARSPVSALMHTAVTR
jgi:hypothetical protein